MELINSIEENSSSQTHHLIDKWVLWAHLPHNTDWSLKSYIKLQNLETVERCDKYNKCNTRKNGKELYAFFDEKNINPV